MKSIQAAIISSIVCATGCVAPLTGPGVSMIQEEAVTPITYDFVFDGSSKAKLFQRARDYFATSFGDSKAVIRVQDEKDGVILGKAAVSWQIQTSSMTGIPPLICHSEYDVRFMAKEGKARLQIELRKGAPSYSRCSGWDLPTIAGYEKIKSDFQFFSDSLNLALQGKGSSQNFRDF